LWRIDRYPDFLAARRELLAAAANTFLNGLRSGASPSAGATLDRISVVVNDPDGQDSRADQIAALVDELTELGCAEPAIDSEISDPATGRVLAIAEACWPEGLQPGQGSPVVLELDPEDSDLPRLKELGYEVFVSCDSLRGYVQRRNREAAGPAPELSSEGEGPPEPVESPTDDFDPGPSPEVRAAFERAMKDVYVRAKKDANYTATYFLTMLSEYGGLATAHRLLASTEVSAGFAALYERGRLDLTVEALVLRPEFSGLFSEEELGIARQRLDQLGYHVSAGA
jgi:hypothetical protein